MNRRTNEDFWLGFFAAAVVTLALYLLWRQRKESELRPTVTLADDREGSPPAASSAADNLEEIRGIGPETARRLREAGIDSFERLASLSPSALRTIVGTTRWDPEEWIVQAKQRKGARGQV